MITTFLSTGEILGKKRREFNEIHQVMFYLSRNSTQRFRDSQLTSFRCFLRETVRLALKVMDPDGVEMRKKRRLKRRNYSSPVTIPPHVSISMYLLSFLTDNLVGYGS